jgi:hypothetical protein
VRACNVRGNVVHLQCCLTRERTPDGRSRPVSPLPSRRMSASAERGTARGPV